MGSTLNIGQDPNSAVSNLIAHDHSDGALGQPIPTAGIANGAVSTIKLANGSVTGAKIGTGEVGTTNVADGSITLVKLGADAQSAQSGGIINVTNYIGNGLKITPSFTNLQATVNTGRVSLGEKTHTLVTPQVIPLTNRMAALVYAKYNSSGMSPILGSVNAQYPVLESDHVGRWIFNQKLNGTTVPDTSTNANNLTITGGTTLVDGWADFGLKLDGTTGFLVSAGSSGFPVGATVRSMTAVVTFHQLPAAQMAIYCYGTATANGGFYLNYNPTGFLSFNHYTTDYPTLFSPIVGQTYIITTTYDGGTIRLYVNGTLVFSLVTVLSTAASIMNVGRGLTTVNLSYITIHYLDIRNTCMIASKVGMLANKALFPNTYQIIGSSYPSVFEPNSHEYRFDDALGTTVLESGLTVQFTVTASTVIGSTTLTINAWSGDFAYQANNLDGKYVVGAGTAAGTKLQPNWSLSESGGTITLSQPATATTTALTYSICIAQTWTGVAGTPNVIVPSLLGLGNARLFTSAVGSKVTIPQPFQMTQTFTAMSVFKFTDVAAYRALMGNYNVASQGFYWALENVAGSPRIGVNDLAGTWYWSTGRVSPDVINFASFTLDNGVLTFYINGMVDSVQKWVPTAGALTLQSAGVAIGDNGVAAQTAYPFQGQIEYFMFNNQVVYTSEEIESAYNSLMLGNAIIKFTDDVLPSPLNSVALGFVRTNTTDCREVNDIDYKYGRNEGAIKAEGNKRRFLGWQFMGLSQTKPWENPFGTDQVDCDIVFKAKMSDYGIMVNGGTIYCGGTYGLFKAGVTPHTIMVNSGSTQIMSSGLMYDGSSPTSGWVGVWAYLL